MTVGSMTKAPSQHLCIDIGIFAHNEQANIADLIRDLAEQSVFADPATEIVVHVLVNGSSDQTVAHARAAVSALLEPIKLAFCVHDFPERGKSRTWNRFVHTLSRPEADLLVMVDGDIRIHHRDVLSGLSSAFAGRPNLRVATSRPVKDIEHSSRKLSIVERAILSGGGALNDWRTSICGQLYAIRVDTAREVWMPIGLPVEDGFLRAMILTDLLTRSEDLQRINGDEAVWHEYKSETTLPGLIRHQTRIVVGSAVNAMLFAVLRRDAPEHELARTFLKSAAEDDAWLTRTEKLELPRRPYGYVPFSFLTKRLSRAFQNGPPRRLSAIVSVGAGFLLDALVYLLATVRMARRGGANYW
jgi:glycosyltransferase involved in cell wall biosynthesis